MYNRQFLLVQSPSQGRGAGDGKQGTKTGLGSTLSTVPFRPQIGRAPAIPSPNVGRKSQRKICNRTEVEDRAGEEFSQ